MRLYRFEVTTREEGTFQAVAAARNDEEAFDAVEAEIEKHFLKSQHVTDVALFEKKKINETGSGFVLEQPAARAEPAGGNHHG
jgi:hypothetical protein